MILNSISHLQNLIKRRGGVKAGSPFALKIGQWVGNNSDGSFDRLKITYGK